jgi:glutathione peroxidase
MRRTFVVTLGMAVAAVIGLAGPAPVKGEEKVSGPLGFKMKGIDGKEVDLAQFKGKVVLFVNVASKCGYTGQYKGLQGLHEKYADKGLVIVGVPVNDFGKQEPGTDDEIAQFCSKNYGVKFTLLAKVPTVKDGAGQAPLYKFLTSKETNPKHGGAVKWNFTKFLVGRDGAVVGRYEPGVTPEAMSKDVEAELAKK